MNEWALPLVVKTSMAIMTVWLIARCCFCLRRTWGASSWGKLAGRPEGIGSGGRGRGQKIGDAGRPANVNCVNDDEKKPWQSTSWREPTEETCWCGWGRRIGTTFLGPQPGCHLKRSWTMLHTNLAIQGYMYGNLVKTGFVDLWILVVRKTSQKAGTTGRGVEINALQSFKESRYQSKFGWRRLSKLARGTERTESRRACKSLLWQKQDTSAVVQTISTGIRRLQLSIDYRRYTWCRTKQKYTHLCTSWEDWDNLPDTNMSNTLSARSCSKWVQQLQRNVISRKELEYRYLPRTHNCWTAR